MIRGLATAVTARAGGGSCRRNRGPFATLSDTPIIELRFATIAHHRRGEAFGYQKRHQKFLKLKMAIVHASSRAIWGVSF
jgi:hypothetical protein